MFIINLVPIKSGGGLQNTLSFLLKISKSYRKSDYLVICIGGGEIEKICIMENINYKSIKPGVLGRIWYEIFAGYNIVKKHKAKLIFSMFGGAPLFSFGVHKISGFAYSNIIQDDVPFWKFLPIKQRIQKNFIDTFRKLIANMASEIILETDYLKKKSEGVLFKKAKIHVVKMAPSLLVTQGLQGQIKSRKDTFDILYLAGAHPNKRIHLLGPIFAILNSGVRRFRLITTLPVESTYFKKVVQSFDNNNCAQSLYNIGPIHPEFVGGLIADVDAMINVALLESFSNNWVEAWAANIPLIATKSDWAKASCGEAAIYIDPSDPLASANILFSVLGDPEAVNQMVIAGKKQLQSLPSADERFAQYINIIESALRKLEVHK